MLANGVIESVTRQKMLLTFKTNGPMPAKQMAKMLGITSSGVHRHLTKLTQEGYIRFECPDTSPGRPCRYYRLTEKSNDLFPEKYDELACELLDALAEMRGESYVRQMLTRQWERAFAAYEAHVANLPLKQKVYRFAQLYDANGYMSKVAEGEEGEEGTYVLIAHNHPQREIVRKYPYVCEIEWTLIRRLLQVPVEQLECISSGGRWCRYLIYPYAS